MDKIILIGFMGAGKTTLGRILAKRLGIAFVDTDERIEKEQKRAVSDIFAKEGETYFRELETEQLKELLEHEECMVLSVGGGLPVQPQNHELLQKLGTTVYLKADIETLVKRLGRDTKRPLLQGGSVEEKIAGLMQEREPVYEKVADKIVHTDGKSVEEAVTMLQQVCERL